MRLAEAPDETVLALNDAIERLAHASHQQAEIVKLRYFVGMEHREIGEALGLTEPTVRRHWSYARVWLYDALRSRA